MNLSVLRWLNLLGSLLILVSFVSPLQTLDCCYGATTSMKDAMLYGIDLAAHQPDLWGAMLNYLPLVALLVMVVILAGSIGHFFPHVQLRWLRSAQRPLSVVLLSGPMLFVLFWLRYAAPGVGMAFLLIGVILVYCTIPRLMGWPARRWDAVV